jgi:stage V sporulation protein B
MIKGLGQQKMSVRYNIITNILDVLFLFFLLPRYGIKGYFFSFLITHVINFLLSIGRLLRITKITIPMHIPLLTLLVACLGVFLCTPLKNAYTATFSYCAILLCGLFLTGILKSEDLQWVRGLLQKK